VLGINQLCGFGSGGRNIVRINITANMANFDLWANRNTAQGASVTRIGDTYDPGNTDFIVAINSGVVIGSTSSATYAFDVLSSFNSKDTISVVSAGTICGAGGAGGTSGGGSGGAGGTALRLQFPVTFDNSAGTLSGGGNGGSGGTHVYGNEDVFVVDSCQVVGPTLLCAGGVGGAGSGANASGLYSAGAGGAGSPGYSSCSGTYQGTGNSGSGGENRPSVSGKYLAGSSHITWIGTAGNKYGTTSA